MARKAERWTLRSSFIDKTHNGQPQLMTERVVELTKDPKTKQWVVHEISCRQVMPEAEQKKAKAAMMRRASEQMSDYISTNDSVIAPGTYKLTDLL
ncbi:MULTISPECIES: hypothetical protein [Caproicibacterium]|jgi:hypothetical protein|uniref:Uncharacterized protein n=1 Tax=Caproicibacterium lactatifermentans TaxID=2666138 RepID=A0A859DNR6_9FIRM|nr:hypothetical protein [Caproicibacterium lactatifermentans]ARP50908.1 hypothetical protein B6259_08545 [Ruminococcaceae bacterium CPB6]QKN23366.1 hypothetical protein GJQ69_01960 [Caproicibacterium lactatifermentans]QKO29956.1 hypothetical protein GKP14_02400 [Caproicibacterium lactatifermentans]